jgi:hypothetical protein
MTERFISFFSGGALFLISLTVNAQVEINRPLEMTGAEDSDRTISNLSLPQNPNDAANKAYVDMQSGGFTHYVGEFFGGGVVFYVYRDASGIEHGRVLALTDVSSGRTWSANTAALANTYAWDGVANCTLMTTQAEDNAGKDCLDWTDGTYDDWYLPSYFEIEQLWNNFIVVADALSSPQGVASGAIAFPTTGSYWTSSETAANQAAVLTMVRGPVNTAVPKNANTVRVRAVRAY